MIKLYGRMIPAVARGMRHDRIAATEPLASRFRVLPHDIDINLHLNNGRYLQLMDVNRVEWLMRTGVLDFVRKHRWKPILGSTVIHFRRELRLWDSGVASTRLIGWDDRWAYLEHRVETPDGKPVAIAMARAGFRARGVWMPIDTLRQALPLPIADLPLPRHAQLWQELDLELARQIGRGRRDLNVGHDDTPAKIAKMLEFS